VPVDELFTGIQGDVLWPSANDWTEPRSFMFLNHVFGSWLTGNKTDLTADVTFGNLITSVVTRSGSQLKNTELN
jgi:hypothetical protein